MRLSDGMRLVADIWRPQTSEALPVLLMRQPYGRAIASTVTLAHPAWYAAHGYLVVVQDVRGTGDSEGEFTPLIHEARDGAETHLWARQLPGGNGQLATYGFSYQGATQYAALTGLAAMRGALPDAMAVAMSPWNPEMDWATEGGVFRTARMTGWAVQMARLKAHRDGDEAALAALDPSRPWQAHFDYLMARPDWSHLAGWAQGGIGAAPAEDLQVPPAVPLLQIAGANDLFLRGGLAADRAFRAVSPGTTHLIIGPWGHIGWNRSAGGARLSAGAEFSVDRAQIAFFDHYLKGIGAAPGACLAYDRGQDAWGALPAERLHAPVGTEVLLRSGGLAATLLTDGELVLADQAEGAPQADGQGDYIVHDPTRPAPLIGGASGDPQGPVEIAALHDRTDVACYTLAPQGHPIRLSGSAVLELAVEVEGPHEICAATLSVVSPDGAVRALSSTVGALKSGKLSFRFDPIHFTLASDAALRLSVQAAPMPDYLPYPVQALPPARIVATTLRLETAACRLLLPVQPASNIQDYPDA